MRHGMGAMQRLVRLAAAFALAVLVAQQGAPARAQEQGPEAGGDAPSVEEVEALIARMRQKIERLGEAAAERDRALEFLRKQVEEATSLIGARDETVESFRSQAAALSDQLAALSRDRDQLAQEMAEREQLLDTLERQIAALSALVGLEPPDPARPEAGLDRLQQELAARLAERDRLREALEERDQKLAALERELAALRAADRQRSAELERERRRLQQQLRERERRLEELARTLEVDRSRIRSLNREIAQLNQRIRGLLELVASMEQTIDDMAERDRAQKIQIAELNARLTEALARKVKELQEYRSEFFGRLKEVLRDQPGIEIVGDRFVFQAELLFPSGSARLDPKGEEELEKLAESLKQVMAKIPEDIDWVLRVDGHTDKVPVGPNSPFRSNWELSTARAITVVEFLIRHGIPPHRLVAAGFGEYRPIDPGDSEEAYRRNRRIEFTLTAR